MSEKGWNRIKYWAVLLNPLLIGLYAAGMKALAGLCMYGGVKRRLPVIAGCGAVGILWLALWTVYWFSKKKKNEKKDFSGKKLLLAFFCAELLFLAGFTGFYGKMIVHSAQQYNGKLAWKLDELQRSKNVELTHDNIYRDGVDGIFTDLEKKLKLPEELYLSNEFTVRFDMDGTIQEIYSFFYGEDRHYLLDYDRAKSEKMTVWISQGGGEKEPGKELTPMREMMKQITGKNDLLKKSADQMVEDFGAKDLKLLYQGYRSFPGSSGLIALSKNGSETSLRACLNEELAYEGYEISLYVPDRKDILPVRYMNAWEKLDLPKKEPEAPERKIGISEREPGTDNVYYMLNHAAGWRLTVADAALGSRFYKLDCTSDGGRTWQTIHEDPFAGNMGVAAGVEFFNDQLGFLLLSGASETHAELYVTRDGGLTVTEVKLPMEAVTDSVPDLEKYQYTTLPSKDGNVLKAELRIEKYDSPRLLFESEDDGITWKFVEYSAE